MAISQYPTGKCPKCQKRPANRLGASYLRVIISRARMHRASLRRIAAQSSTSFRQPESVIRPGTPRPCCRRFAKTWRNQPVHENPMTRTFAQFRLHQPQKRGARTDLSAATPLTPRPGTVQQLFGIVADNAAAKPLTLDQVLSQRLDIAARVAGEEQHFHQLVIGEPPAPAAISPLAQALAMAVKMRRRAHRVGEAKALLPGLRHRRCFRRACNAAWAAAVMRRGSSVANASTKASMRARRGGGVRPCPNRISDFWMRIACGPAGQDRRGQCFDRRVEFRRAAPARRPKTPGQRGCRVDVLGDAGIKARPGPRGADELDGSSAASTTRECRS